MIFKSLELNGLSRLIFGVLFSLNLCYIDLSRSGRSVCDAGYRFSHEQSMCFEAQEKRLSLQNSMSCSHDRRTRGFSLSLALSLFLVLHLELPELWLSLGKSFLFYSPQWGVSQCAASQWHEKQSQDTSNTPAFFSTSSSSSLQQLCVSSH